MKRDRPGVWRNFKREKPKRAGMVVVLAPTWVVDRPFLALAWYEPGIGWGLISSEKADDITHWMPLSKPSARRTYSPGTPTMTGSAVPARAMPVSFKTHAAAPGPAAAQFDELRKSAKTLAKPAIK